MKRALFVICLLFVAACSRHDDSVPPMLAVDTPPQPTNFQVSTQDSIVYDLSWDVADPTVVNYYRIYTQIMLPFFEAQMDTTSSTSAQVNLGTQLPVQFCVSSVTFQNVESSRTCATSE